MRLHSLKIAGFKRIKQAEILFGQATFLIGCNNSGKSTVLKAIEYLLSARKQLTSQEYYSIIDSETGETKIESTIIILEGEFRNLPIESKSWRGFKGRIFEYFQEGETGLSVTYRKTYELGKDVKIEFKSKVREISKEFSSCKTGQDYIDRGIDSSIVSELFPELNKVIGKNQGAFDKLEELDDIWDIQATDTWFKNPGGIPGNVLKMLPRFLVIPVDTSINEIQGSSSGVLGKTLNELFEDVRVKSLNYQNAQIHLNKLAKELNPEDKDSEFGKMIGDLNTVLASVFPDSKLHATADLSDPDKVLKPSFSVEMSSNIRTTVENQGSGMVRAAAFGMLRFRQKWLSQKEDEHARSLVICFEEPEIYLHPSAANQMRNAIYELSGFSSQIIATTHSPYIIDLSKKPRQILNRLSIDGNEIKILPFIVSDTFQQLVSDDKQYVKMLLKLDDYVSRVFFTENVVIIEGDTEDILIKESLKRLKRENFLNIISRFEVIKARGKAAIIGLVKYLTAMGIRPIVVHDRDNGTEGATKYNKPIEDAVGSNGRIVLMIENVENEIGYSATYEKPFKAFQETEKWGGGWLDIPENWRKKMKEIFGEYIVE
ncbi:MAG: AAA family ATPase [Bacteroidales bacterium]|nr:AAA family ATPase [Bacteroidales bacterium]